MRNETKNELLNIKLNWVSVSLYFVREQIGLKIEIRIDVAFKGFLISQC